jgi:EAL domain-containing protein (putative c-di-GMP-specific phosphodiesterase class I)
MQLGLLGEMRRAVEEDELVLHYQPQVDLRSGEVVGVEALVRWRHPVRGLLMPADFLPMAEQTGLMRALTTWVLDRALEQWSRWKADGRDLPMAVNLSVPNVLDINLPTEVAGLLAKWDVPADRLQLEITENVVVADPARVATVLGELKAIGVRLALDDFGTGQSSLSYLKTLPLDELKIDRSFVRDLTTDAQDAAIVQSTAELGRRLGLQVLAEGLETPGAWDKLAEFGCERAQGFHMSKPLPASELTDWLERWSSQDRRAPAGAATLAYRGSTMAVGDPAQAPSKPAARKNPKARITYRGTELG